MTEFLVATAKVILIPVVVLNLLPLLIWMERKGAAYFQDRRGPNRASILGIRLGGMIHNLADVIKLLTKEGYLPPGANKFYFVLAPFLVLFIYTVTVAVIPFGDDLKIGDLTLTLQVADLNVGVLYIFSMASLAVYGIMLAGWSSNNKYSLLGALRASSQMISYEIALGLSVVSLFMISESVDLNEIIRHQSPSILSWNVVRQPLAFLLFLVAAFAETNRTPFDLPEGESELVAGYHVEYSGMPFGMFYMGEYVAIIASSAVMAALFFGGWQVPFIGTEELIAGAPFYLNLAGMGFAVFSVLAGLFLVLKFRPGKYKDARDYEVLVLGIPAILAGVLAGLFFFTGGFHSLPDWAGPVFAATVQAATFLAKIFFLCFFFIWIRWTLPRFRYDQLMAFGWKGMLPLALFNILATGLYLLVA
jgi:NADH-quinone oxidoreductase subunit H